MPAKTTGATVAASPPSRNLIELRLDDKFNLQFHADSYIVGGLGLIFAAMLASRLLGWRRRFWKTLEINEAEFGLGDQKIKLSPNVTDQQIAYKIWIELSTRKIGIPIDPVNDIISEVYDSWFNFFAVTRELIKDVPVRKFHRKDTEQIIRISIEVLNQGIRPHLTLWQARFRRWYDHQLELQENAQLHPQDIQKNFPQFSELMSDLLAVNHRLINYREKMREIIRAA